MSVTARGLRGLALGALVFLIASRASASAEIDPPWTPIGFSQAGEPIVVFHLGLGRRRVVLLGGQHGGPEANTTALARGLLEYFSEHPEEIPAGVGLDILPAANPDGLASGSRQFLNGIDPNRNWGGPDWSTDGYDSNARFVRGLGGPEPFSEPETRALADWLVQHKPTLVINYHSAGGFLFGPRDGPGADLVATYAEASGYSWAGGRGEPSPLPYRATGNMNGWLRQESLAGILIELTTPSGTEFDRNLAGVQAVLTHLAAQ